MVLQTHFTVLTRKIFDTFYTLLTKYRYVIRRPALQISVSTERVT